MVKSKVNESKVNEKKISEKKTSEKKSSDKKINEKAVNSIDKIKREINKKKQKAIEMHNYDEVIIEKENLCNTNLIVEAEKGTTEDCNLGNQGVDESETQKRISKTEFVVFRLSDEEYAMELLNVKEIIRVPEITKVPSLSMDIAGVCNLRGELVTIIDIHKRFNIPQKELSENSRVIVMEHNSCSIGIIVDKISQVLGVDKSSIKLPLGGSKETKEDCINGIIMEEHGKRLIMIMALQGIVNGIESVFTSVDKQSSDKASVFTKEKEETQQLIIFNINAEEYAFHISNVKEIIRLQSIVKPPDSADFMEGILSLRNNLIAVVNLSKLLKMNNTEINMDGSIIIIDAGNFSYGVIVDRVSEVARVSKEVLRKPSQIVGDIDIKIVKEFANLDNGKRVVMVLDPYKLIDIEELGRDYQDSQKDVVSNYSKESAMQSEDLTESIVIFKIENEEYGVRINFAQEINRISKITSLPNAPDFIEGLVNLRGDMIPMLNLRRFLGLGNEHRDSYSKLLIVKLKKVKIGIAIDSASEVLKLSKDLFEDYSEILNSKDNRKCIEGVIKLNGGNRIVLVLDLKGILDFL